MVIIGVMSGTSLDGLDLACVEFTQTSEGVDFQLLGARTYPHQPELLKSLSRPFSLSGEELTQLDHKLGEFIGDLTLQFIKDCDLPQPDVIASHGHTIYHRPSEGWTLQIGNGQKIAQKTQIRTICDFRAKDLALGGQGAPLVPIGDRDLFKEFECCINIGGITNITRKQSKLQAYDICVGNLPLNYLSRKIGVSYDENGELASRGSIDNHLLKALNDLPYHKEQPPKSLGLEWVEEHIYPAIEKSEKTNEDKLSTVVEHIAQQVSSNLNGDALITGGGALNAFLIKRISANTDFHITVPNRQTIEFKEAIVFAYLGYLFELKKPNVLSSVTGSSRDHIGGYLFTP